MIINRIFGIGNSHQKVSMKVLGVIRTGCWSSKGLLDSLTHCITQCNTQGVTGTELSNFALN